MVYCKIVLHLKERTHSLILYKKLSLVCDLCLIAGVVSLCHTLPCAQQQPEHRERLETFDDVIRNTLEVMWRKVSDERKCTWS